MTNYERFGVLFLCAFTCFVIYTIDLKFERLETRLENLDRITNDYRCYCAAQAEK